MLGSGDSSYIIKLRGLPFKTTVEDVLDFLGPVNVVNGKEGNFHYANELINIWYVASNMAVLFWSLRVVMILLISAFPYLIII